MQESNHLYNIRHSAAHIVAQAVIRLFPGTKQAIGPVTENGFFADLQTTTPVKEQDLSRVEDEMRKIVQENLQIIGRKVTKTEARSIYKDNQFKLDLLDRIEDEFVGVYTQGEYHDLCRGGHTEFTGAVKFFKLISVSGSYWKGKKDNVQLQRITGVAFESQKELDQYFEKLELAKKLDHRIFGKDLKLFTFLPEAPGMPLFQPKGYLVVKKLITFVQKLLKQFNYQEIKTPMMLKETLWHQSGHYENYKDNMFFCNTGLAEQEEMYCVKPMNCPGAMLLFKEGLRSYRELPLRFAEFGQVHRYELSGALHGLFRVRTFTQDDAHIFVSEEILADELKNIVKMAMIVYDKFSFKKVYFAVSTRPAKSIGDDSSWNIAIEALKNALIASNIDFVIQEGEGAFYGPKIDIMIEDVLERKWQCGTIQIDFFMPQRFELEYVASNQERKTPIVIHRAILGSVERFLGILLEHYKGALPFWLAPVQVKILPITEKQNNFCEILLEKLSTLGFNVEIDLSSETISAKIRQSTQEKVPIALIVGSKEVENNTLTLRKMSGEQIQGIPYDKINDELCKFYES